MAFLIGICFFIAVCIIAIPKIGGMVSSTGFWMVVFGFLIGITCIYDMGRSNRKDGDVIDRAVENVSSYGKGE